MAPTVPLRLKKIQKKTTQLIFEKNYFDFQIALFSDFRALCNFPFSLELNQFRNHHHHHAAEHSGFGDEFVRLQNCFICKISFVYDATESFVIF